MLTAATRMLGVIGWPIEHSLSPIMQQAAFNALGLQWAYGAFAVQPDRLAAAVAGAAALGFVGVNVTIPHKEAALSLCQPDERARLVGAVNTLSFVDGAVLGSNTDVHGFTSLCREAGVPLRAGLTVGVLGAGGAARAVVFALREAGATFWVASRTPGRMKFPAGGGSVPVLALSREVVSARLPACDLLVDCTPRGLVRPLARRAEPVAALAQTHPELDLALLSPRAVVLDLVVGPGTLLCRAARGRGLRTAGGAGMLLHQGAAALGLWLDKPVPEPIIQVMRSALDTALMQLR